MDNGQLLDALAERFETYASDQGASIRWQSTSKQRKECTFRAEMWRQAAQECRDVKRELKIVNSAA